jgi:hypothetical protein
MLDTDRQQPFSLILTPRQYIRVPRCVAFVVPLLPPKVFSSSSNALHVTRIRREKDSSSNANYSAISMLSSHY